MSFPNVYTHRKVADTAAKACEICFRVSSSVLITPDNKDFFYVCASHLKDKGFCSPIVDKEAEEAKKKKKEQEEKEKELKEEIERVKKEYEEKKKKKEKEKEDKDKDKDKNKDKEKDKADEDKKDPKDKEKEKASTEESPPEEEPRIFALQRTFYQQRLEKKRQIEISKRNRERLANPNFFPSVPKGLP